MDDLHAFLAKYETNNTYPILPEGYHQYYHVLSCLKSTKQSQVYLISSKPDGYLYILRVAPVSDLPRLNKEFRLMLMLHDNAFPHPVACFSDDEHAFLIREYIPGSSLADYVENAEALSPAETAQIAQKICAAVNKLHALNPPVIHRDIKPQNIILSADGLLHLVDLDAMQEFNPEKPLDTIVMGTAATAAPEQFGYKRCDARTDVYGIGMLMKYLLTGEFDINSRVSWKRAGGLSRIIRKCLSFDPSKRYHSVNKLSKKISHYRHRTIRWTSAAICVALLTFFSYCVFENRDALSGLSSAFFQISPRTVHHFSSPLVEAAARLQLNRPVGSIAEEELINISQLYLCGNMALERWEGVDTFGADIFVNGSVYDEYGAVHDLSDIGFMPNLRRLALYRVTLTDIKPLEKLTLTHLALAGNRIKDISPLSSITTLMELDISDNPITSLEPLRKCKILKKLSIGATLVKDLAPLESLPLESLKMYDLASDTDFSSLASLPALNNVGARFMPRPAVDLLLSHKDMKGMTLFFCEIDSLKDFAGMSDLNSLNLYGNSVAALDGIENLPSLRYLDLYGNKIGSIRALSGHTALECIVLANNPVTDLAPLINLPKLRELTLSQDQQEASSNILKELPIQITYIK